MLIIPNLLSRFENRGEPNDLVKTSVGCFDVDIWKVLTVPAWTFSLTRWQSISMCFVRSWNTGIDAMWSAAWLSNKNLAGCECSIPRSCKMYWSQVISQQTDAMEPYSASALERETMICFLVFQEIRECPRKMKYHVADRLVSRYLAQSTSHNAFNCNELVEKRKIPCPGVWLMYYKTCCAASRCGARGLSMNWLRMCTA